MHSRFVSSENKKNNLLIHTSHWTRQAAEKMHSTPENTFPFFDVGRIKSLMPGYNVWDSWFVMTEEGMVADVDGFRILMALVKLIEDDKHTVTTSKATVNRERIAYFYSSDGIHYRAGGYLFHVPLFNDTNEWSGSTILRNDGCLQTFYTVARGIHLGSIWQTEQRFATAIQRIYKHLGARRISIEEPHVHCLLAEPDGQFYETASQALNREAAYTTRHNRQYGDEQTDNFCFRDPKFVKDKESGRCFLLFEANTGSEFCPPGFVNPAYLGVPGEQINYAPCPDDLKSNACVGVLELTNAEYTFGVFHQPWLTANLVTDEIERINVIFYDSSVYLFVVGHGNKCSLVTIKPDLQNRDYMLGFRAPYLFGPLEPLNDSGVVLQQKSLGDTYVGQEKNQQYVYSWLIIPTNEGNIFDCISYANYSTNAQGKIVANKSAGPTVSLKIDGLETSIVDRKYTILPTEARRHLEKKH